MVDVKNFIVEEVLNELMDQAKGLVEPLMKLQYFSLLIKNQELKNYTTNEINGPSLMNARPEEFAPHFK